MPTPSETTISPAVETDRGRVRVRYAAANETGCRTIDLAPDQAEALATELLNAAFDARTSTGKP